MEVKTITQGRDGCKVSGAYKLIFPIRKDYYHIRNDGTETAYASVFTDSTDTAEDGVYDIPSGGTLCIRSHGSDTLYVSGEVTVMGTASAVCPFKIGLRGGDGYADVTATGNPVQLDGLQGGVPFSEIVVSGDDIVEKELTVNVCGKNLIPYPYSRASGTYNGIELTVHDDGRFDMSGTATASFAILVFASGSNPIYLSGGQTYTISCNTPYDFSKFNLSARIYRADGNYTAITKFPTTFVAKEGDYLTSTLWIDSDVSVSAKNVELQLELGDTATEYETPVGSKITITPDSNPYVIPNDIRQLDGLNTISVSAGTLSVTGVRKNAAIKRIWEKLDELTTAMIVSNGETE